MIQQQFTVTNIKCSACVKVIRLLLLKIGGVFEAAVDEASGRVQLYAAQPIEPDVIRERLADHGYKVGEGDLV